MPRNPAPFDHASTTDQWIEELLDGSVAPGGLNPADAALADMVAAMTAPTTEADLVGFDEAIAAFVAAQPAGPAVLSRASRTARRLRALAAVVAVCGGVAMGAVAAAAYTGSLPPGLQDIAHHTIGAPAPHRAPELVPGPQLSSPEAGPASTPGASPGATGTAPPGPTPGPASPATPSPAPTTTPRTGPATIPGAASATTTASPATDSTAKDLKGLCQAYVSGGLPSHSSAYRKLQAAAGGQGVDAYCAAVLQMSTLTATPTATDITTATRTTNPAGHIPGKGAAPSHTPKG